MANKWWKNKIISSNRTDSQILIFMGIVIVIGVINGFYRDYIDNESMSGLEYDILALLIGIGILLRGIISIKILNKNRTNSKKK